MLATAATLGRAASARDSLAPDGSSWDTLVKLDVQQRESTDE